MKRTNSVATRFPALSGPRCGGGILGLFVLLIVPIALCGAKGTKLQSPVAFYVPASKAGTPLEINYQGWLGNKTDTTGITGKVNIAFRLYTAPTGGSDVWTENQDSVSVDKGIFNVLLGSVGPLPADIFTGAALYLETEVGGEVLSPRKKLVSVAYAIRAQKSDTADYAVSAGINYVDSARVSVNSYKWNNNLWGTKYPTASKSDTASYVAGANVVGEVANANKADTATYAITANVTNVDSANVSANSWNWNNNLWGVDYPKADKADTALYVAGANVSGEVANANKADTAIYAETAAGAPPSGTAGGDLSGTYPNPTVAVDKIDSTKVPTDGLSSTDIKWLAGSKVIGDVPSATYATTSGGAPPSGSAGGDLSGTYPNPTVAVNKIDSTKVPTDGLSGTDLKWLAGSKVTGSVPLADYATTSGGAPPSGSAGGDLSGTYPNPTVAVDKIDSTKVPTDGLSGTDIKWLAGSKVTGAVASATYATTSGGAPPSGSAGGDLSGNYPNPTVAVDKIDSTKVPTDGLSGTDLKWLSGAKLLANTVDSTKIPTDGLSGTDLKWLAGGKVVGAVAEATYATTSGGAPPTGSAGGALSGTYPNPGLVAIDSTKTASNGLSSSNIKWLDGSKVVGEVANANRADTADYVISSDKITDADNDTKIQVEESPDEDIIRFDVANEEGFVMKMGTGGIARLEQVNSNSSVFIGENAGNNSDEDEFSGSRENTFIGASTGQSNITGRENTFIGASAGLSNTDGNDNVFIGRGASYRNSTGSSNISIGRGAGEENTTASENIAIGGGASGYNTAGTGNTVIGHRANFSGGGYGPYESSSYNTIIGYNAGYNVDNGDDGNVMLGYQAGYNETGSNKLYIDNSSTAAPLIYGDFSANTVHINGTFTATTKSFEIDHPTKPGYKLVHGCLEGPENGVYYRGEAKLVNDEAVIELPDYFESLTRKEGRTVQLTCKGGYSPLYYESIKDGKFVVRTTGEGNPGQEFSWEVRAIRADVEPLTVETRR